MKRLISIALSLFICNQAWAAVALDGSAGSETYQNSVTTKDSTFTVGAGSELALVVTLNFGNSSVSNISATWDQGGTNQAMTQLVLKQSGAASSAIFGLRNPTVGSNLTLRVSWTTTSEVFIAAIAFSGVNQTNDLTAFPHTAVNSGITSTISIPSVVGNKVVGCEAAGVSQGTATGTQIYDDHVSGAIINAMAEYDSGAASVSIGNSGSNSTIVAVDIGASGTAALVAHNLCSSGGSGCTTGAMNTTSATLLVAVLGAYSTATPCSATVSDSNSNTWHPLTAQSSGTNGNECMWYAYDKGGTALVVGAGHTVSVASSSFPGFEALAFSGTLTGADPLDAQNGSAAGTSANPFQPGSVTPGADGEVIVSGYGGNEGLTPLIDSNLTVSDYNAYGSVEGSGAAWYIQSTATAINPGWSDFTNLNVGGTTAAFKIPGSTPAATATSTNMPLMGI